MSSWCDSSNTSICDCYQNYTYAYSYNSYPQGWDFYFAYLATEFSYAMQGQPSIENLQALYGYIFLGNDNAIEVINNSNNQIGPIITLTIFGLLGILPILVISYLVIRQLCKCLKTKNDQSEKKKSLPLTGHLWTLHAAIYLTFVVFLAVGMALFAYSVTGFHRNLSGAINMRYNIYGVINELNNKSTIEMDCYSSNMHYIINDMIDITMQGPNITLGQWMDANEVYDLNDFDEVGLLVNYEDLASRVDSLINELEMIQKDGHLTDKLCIDEIQQLLTQLNLVSDVIEQLIELMSPIMLQTNVTVTDTLAKLDEFTANLSSSAASLSARLMVTPGKIDTVLTSTSNAALYDNSISTRLNNFFGRGATLVEWSHKYAPITIFIYFAVYIPSVIMLLVCITAFVVSVCCLLDPKIDMGRMVRILSLFMRIGSYTAFASTWYLFVMVLVLFWLSSAFSASCPVIYSDFYEDNYALYQLPGHSNILYFTNFNGENLTMDYSLFRQNYHQTVFDTINGDSWRVTNGQNGIMNHDMIMNFVDINSSQTESTNSLNNFDLSVNFDQTLAENFTMLAGALQMERLQLAAFTGSCLKMNSINNFDTDFLIFLSKLNSTSDNTNKLQIFINTTSTFTDTTVEDTRDNMVRYNNWFYESLITDAISSTVNGMMLGLTTNVWPNIDVYDASGDTVCNGVLYSLNEIWASMCWLAIFILLAGFLLRYTARKFPAPKPAIDATTLSEPPEYNEEQDIDLSDPPSLQESQPEEAPVETSLVHFITLQ